MTTQTEQILEDNLIKQLTELGHSFVAIRDEADLIRNLKFQLEKHNNRTLSDTEFKQVLNKLDKGTVFEKAKILRDKMLVISDDATPIYLELINQEQWCKNQFQVANQITVEGSYKNRFDVTLLINGIPLVQIELKRRGLELKEAFNQINRYQKHSYWSAYGLFQYVQIFIISNGVNTKYLSNNKFESFKQTFYWANEKNELITELHAFTKVFLEPCHIAKMITKYIVLHESDKCLMVLRPYQYYAAEAIVERVKTTHKNGYIWHTTGSGKTLTSFKTSQLLIDLPKVHKVVFVVDRKDLDNQTTREFNAFSEGSVNGTASTFKLVEQLANNTKLVVTTIQKLDKAICKQSYLSKIEHLKTARVIFIFDECHRSQFGDTHKRITQFFDKAQLFGFTGTPIFEDNSTANEHGKRTTKMLFDECLHRYVITDAIKDENVLKFSIEYVGRYKRRDDSQNEIDINIEDIDRKELMESPIRLQKITEYILAQHERKTHSRQFTAMFCVSSVDVLIQYYEMFKALKQQGRHNLNIATIFSFTANEDDKDANGFIPDDLPDFDAYKQSDTLSIAADGQTEYSSQKPLVFNPHTRDKLEEYIGEYNAMFCTSFTTKDTDSFYRYYSDIAKKVKTRNIDILLVVNMFLTGFDSKWLNTLYVDKNLKYHGLVQAFSRTNRILNETKSQGNIVCFRNLKDATDTAITLFSNKEAKEDIIIAPYEEYVDKFNKAALDLLSIVPTVKSVDKLASEDDELEFIKAFRELMRLKNVLTTFADFDFGDLSLSEQTFEDYKSKYLDLYDKVRTARDKQKESILQEVDFELELIHRDEINVAYILKLLAKLNNASGEDKAKQRKSISDIISGDPKLRSKKELIEEFIDDNLIHISDGDDIPEAFLAFIAQKQSAALIELCESEKLDPDKFSSLLENHLFTGRIPLDDEIVSSLSFAPKLLERLQIVSRIKQKITDFVELFINGIG